MANWLPEHPEVGCEADARRYRMSLHVACQNGYSFYGIWNCHTFCIMSLVTAAYSMTDSPVLRMKRQTPDKF